MKRVFALLAMVIISLALISCADVDNLVDGLKGDDGDIVSGENNRTVDVEVEGAELIAVSVLQATFIAHLYSGLNDFLDASDLPDNAVPLGTDNHTFFASCDTAGSVELTFPRTAGEPHRAGDQIKVVYDNCDKGDGVTRNGTLTARYSEIKGLNDRFVEMDTSACVANIQARLGSSVRIINVLGDDLIFVNEQDKLRVRVDGIDTDALIGKNEAVIVVKQLADPEDNAVTSLNGDQIYSVVSRTNKKEACQEYQRTLVAILDNYTSRKGDLEIALNGEIDLFSGTHDLDRFVAEIRDSSFTATVKQGYLEEQFSMSGYTITQTFGLTSETYAYEIEGSIYSSAINGMAFIRWQTPLSGHFAETYPTAGVIGIMGRDLEQVAVGVFDSHLSIQVDHDGDSTGNGFGDFDEVISTSWPELMAREFKRSE